MDSLTIIIPIAGLVLAFGGMLILTPRMLSEKHAGSIKKNGFEFACPNCQNALLITRESMTTLKGVEAALVIQNFPSAPAYDLAEQRCGSCSSILTFRTDEWPAVFLMCNEHPGRKASNKCVECREPLVRPSWPRGIYDEKIDDIVNINPKLGLRCPRCDAVSCVSCLETVTRNRTNDGSYLCPRCFRNPVNLVHHF